MPAPPRKPLGFASIACLVGLTVALATAVTVRAEDIPGPPDAPCTLGERMNIHIIDGWMYSCDCEVLAHGFNCQWNLVGQVAESNALRRFRKRHHAHRRLIPVLYIKRVIA